MDENTRINRLLAFLKEDPADSFSAHALALEYVKLGKLDEAETLWTQLLHRDKNYVGSYYHIGKLFEQKGNADSAVKYYREGIAIAAQLSAKHAQSELQQALDELEE